MFHFPPTAWEVHGLNFSSAAVFPFLILIGLVVALRIPASSRTACGRWAFVSICLFWLNVPLLGKFSDPAYPPNPIDHNLFVLLPIVGVVGMLKTLWRNVREERDGGFGILAGGGVALLGGTVIMILTSLPLATPYSVVRPRQCKNNLKQIALAMRYYHDVYQRFHPGWQSGQQNSWRVGILPYLGEESCSQYFERYDQNAAWDSAQNLPLSKEFIREFDCPARPEPVARNDNNQFLTPYVAPAGQDALFDGKKGRAIRDIKDGSSNTLMILEACGNPVIWTKPKDFDTSAGKVGVNLPSNRIHRSDGLLSSYHGGGAQAALADGAVRFISEDIDTEVLKALLTPQGMEANHQF